jgi:Zn-dependent protease with chaperone function
MAGYENWGNKVMQRDEFNALVGRLEERARRNPGRYEWYVAGLVALAYGYLAGVLVLTTGITLAVIALAVAAPNVLTIKLALIVGLLAGGISLAIIKGLWVKLTPPQGIELTARDAPELFALIGDLQRRLRSAPFHKVLLVADYNAAVVQLPRLGVFGWQQNYLLIGLPLMLGLDADEFRAVLAHEFGHLSKNHSRFNAWIYRVRRTWDQVFQQMFQRRRSDLGLLRKFLQWYWPKFNASAFVLSRIDEYVADRCSADLAGAGPAASALLRVRVHRPLVLEKFWPELFALAKEQAAPPANPFSELAARFASAGDPGETAKWLRAGLLEPTSNADTHPCLRERLEAIGQLPAGLEEGRFPTELPPHSGTSAAGVFLGARLGEWSEKLGREWSRQIEKKWGQRHREVQELKKQLAEADAKIAGEASVENLWNRAQLLLKLDGDLSALATVAEILQREPDHAGANFVQGRHLLAQGEAAGVPLVERAIESDPSLGVGGMDLLHQYYRRRGEKEKLRELEALSDQYQGILGQARLERTTLKPGDVFLPHELKPGELAEAIQVLAAEPAIRRACLARKQVKYLTAQRLFVLRLDVKKTFWSSGRAAAIQRIVQNVVKSIQLPGATLVFVAEGNYAAPGRAVLEVPGSTIYTRNP